jgi:hypothetical protein
VGSTPRQTHSFRCVTASARYWIDDRDQQSKSVFNSILLLFSLTETAQASTAPVVTIAVKE